MIFTEDRPLTFGLPSTGQANAVHTVCVASYHWEKNLPSTYAPQFHSGTTWRLLFLGADSCLLGAAAVATNRRRRRCGPPTCSPR
jgi:hypothetical protein